MPRASAAAVTSPVDQPLSSPGPAPPEPPAPLVHSWIDDGHALIAGSLFVALGLTMYSHVGLITGGVAGAAFLTRYATGASLGGVFFLLNLPFFVLAWRQLGPEFTLKSFAAVTLVSLSTTLAPLVVGFDHLNPWVAAVLGYGLPFVLVTAAVAGPLLLWRRRRTRGEVATAEPSPVS